MPRVDAKKKYYYHITSAKWGNRVKLYPKSDGRYRAVDEPDTPRICVCDSIAGCINAVWCCYSLSTQKKISVYRTLNKRQAIIPVGVYDAHITGEKWLLSPSVFIKMGNIDPLKIYALGKLNYNAGSYLKKDLKEQFKAMKKLKKVRSFLK